MPAPGATAYQHYRSTTAGHIPAAANMAIAEFAINLVDRAVFTYDGTAVFQIIGTLGAQNANAVAVTGGTINGTVIGGTTPSSASFTSLNATGNLTVTGTSNATGGAYDAGTRVWSQATLVNVSQLANNSGYLTAATGVSSVNGQHGAATVGSVTAVAAGNGLNGGTITSSGTINLNIGANLIGTITAFEYSGAAGGAASAGGNYNSGLNALPNGFGGAGGVWQCVSGVLGAGPTFGYPVQIFQRVS